MPNTCPICLQDNPCQCETSDYETRERMLSGQCEELAATLNACAKHLIRCHDSYRRANNLYEAQLCSDFAMQAQLVLKKWRP